MALAYSDHMQRAIERAREAVGTTSPNPPVGAVLVKNGEVIGEGHTQPSGLAHAEIEALRMAGAAARGAELFVTLEPCAHHGRTPACTDALIAAGVAKVHVAAMDPAPHTDARGIAALRAAGIETEIVHDHREAHQLVEAFAKHATTGVPFVIAKFAMSLDGKIATRSGESRWISNEASRREAHRLRSECDAVMVGIGTALADDPKLTVRDVPMKGGQPLRVVVDSSGRFPHTASMLSEEGRTLVAVASSEASDRIVSAATTVASGVAGKVDLRALMSELGSRGVMSVLVEGGAELHASIFEYGLVDKVVAFIAPIVVGGASAPGPVGGYGSERIVTALRLERVTYTDIDGDMMVIGYPMQE